MLLTGIPNQWVQKQLDDLCVATPPHKRELMENFVRTNRFHTNSTRLITQFRSFSVSIRKFLSMNKKEAFVRNVVNVGQSLPSLSQENDSNI